MNKCIQFLSVFQNYVEICFPNYNDYRLFTRVLQLLLWDCPWQPVSIVSSILFLCVNSVTGAIKGTWLVVRKADQQTRTFGGNDSIDFWVLESLRVVVKNSIYYALSLKLLLSFNLRFNADRISDGDIHYKLYIEFYLSRVLMVLTGSLIAT